MGKRKKNDRVRVVVDKKASHKEKDSKIRLSLLYLCLAFVLIAALGYFATCLFHIDDSNFLEQIIGSLLLVLFSILFITNSFAGSKKSLGTIYLSMILLFGYFIYQTGLLSGIITFPSFSQVEDFTGKSLTEVVEWAEANRVTILQDYEYSDMVTEYSVISQNIKPGTKLKDVKNITIAISEGPNPSKEIIIPNMVSWDTERVLNFVKNNYLSNVEVEFVESDKAQDTVIEQDKSGNLARNDTIKLTFSAGESFENSEIKLIDFTGKSKFETTFYFKQHRIRYDFDEKFSNKIKRGYAVSQDVGAGTMVKANDQTVTVSISKGPKIKVPDLQKMKMAEITDWIIKNKLKLEFSDRYDDSIKENAIIEVNYHKGDIICQNTVIKIVLSKGKLKMPKFSSLNEFREWADKYRILYEEKYEFSDSVEAGHVISYSYKTGETIKNNDVVIVTISDGEKQKIPNLEGLSKSDVIEKLKKAGLAYNFVYKSSNSIAKDKVISQSISAGSEVAKGTTITITLSSGKDEKKEQNSNTHTSNNDNHNSSSSEEIDNCVTKTYTIGRELNNIFKNYTGYSAVRSALESFLSSTYPDVSFRIVGVDGGDATSGSYIGGIGPGTQVSSCNGKTYTIEIAK